LVNLKLIRLKFKKWLNSIINWLYLDNKLIFLNVAKEKIIKNNLLLTLNMDIFLKINEISLIISKNALLLL
jgi:hypothetical protein